ncbi:unnamed protein product [Blepharisma stoltei]|uniref:IPO4/5-like TPR repeats domain-containing protein n=1 Tax=Blepharisma stoltei TaxID=1481888 RepID=A0AAU9IA26_9CILI|nr:unnamed protein product [Blepharisma stoltei]
MVDFEKILISILSTEKATRQHGEANLEALLKSSPEQACYGLISAISTSNPEIAGLAAILFRKKLLDEEYIKTIPESSCINVKSSLIGLVMPEKPLSLLKLIADDLVGLAVINNWAHELMSFMGQWSSSENSTIKQFSMYLFELATEHSGMMVVMSQNADSVMTIMWNALQCPENNVRLSACKTIMTFMIGLSDEIIINKYVQALDYILDLTAQVLKEGNYVPDHLCQVLFTLAELTEAYPRLWKEKIEKLASNMSGIARNYQLATELRAAAIEVIITLIKKIPGRLKKNVYFIQEILALGFSLTTEVDFPYDLDGWNQEGPELVVIQNDPYSLGKDLLLRMANFLQEAIFPYAMQLIPAHLQAPHWANQHTGILAIGIISEGCKPNIRQILPHIISTLTPFANSDSPRLKWAVMTTIGLLCSEFHPELQNAYHFEILSAILSCLSSNNLAKVQAQASASMVNYSKGLLYKNSSKDLALFPYLSTLIQHFLSILTSPSSPLFLLQEALNAIAMIACASESNFAPYYHQLVYGLRKLINSNGNSPAEKEVRATCIKCLGCIIESVGEAGDAFKDDAVSLLDDLMRIRSTLNDADQVFQAINEVLSYFASSLKERFAPYLEVLIPQIFAHAEQVIDFKFADAESADALCLDQGMSALQFELRGLGKKQLAISTTCLENKIKACKILYDLVSSLGVSFSPYVDQAAQILSKLITFPYNSVIRKYSLKAVQNLQSCCASQTQAELFLRTLVPNFIIALAKSGVRNPGACNKQLRVLLRCMKKVQNVGVIGISSAQELSRKLAMCLNEVLNRKNCRSHEQINLAEQDLYEEELAEFEESERIDDEILQKTMEIVGILLKSYKTQFQPIFLQEFKSIFGEFLYKPNATENETLFSLCMFCDYVEFTHDIFFSNTSSPIVEQFIKNCYHHNPDIRQSAAYGLGLSAYFGDPTAFRIYLQESIKAINYMLNLPDSRSEKLLVSSECAAGALGKIALYHASELIPNWLNWLPFKSDPEEAQIAHTLLFDNINLLNNYNSKVAQICAEMKTLPLNYLPEKSCQLLG